MGSGISTEYEFEANVYALAVCGSNLYAGGSFTEVGGLSANNIAQWNGNSWSALGSGINGRVSALAVSGSDLYVGGAFDMAGNVPAANVAKWNGSAWSALGSGMNGAVTALAVSPTKLYVAGNFTTPSPNIAQWNGSSWSDLGLGVDGFVNGLAVSGDNLYVGGQFSTVGGIPANSIAEWNGSTWSPLGSGVNSGAGQVSGVGALALDSSGNLYVSGGFTMAGTNVSAYIAKAILTGPTPNQLLLANAGGGTNVFTYLGTPGGNYALDLATSLTPPVNWMPQTTNTASIGNVATAGYLMLTNSNHQPQAYYRTRSVP